MQKFRDRNGLVSLFTFALTLVLAVTAARACLWDRDTLGIEARGLPGVAEIITGRFERNPPLYYEMRLARVTRALETSPGDLDLYDDAGVACDKLGRGDEAIAWMAAKKKQLDALGEADPKHRDHLYRYYANQGTFHAHRWVSSGKNRDDLEDMKIGRDLIAKAIEINPDAHFGREKYQLAVMEWIINVPMNEEDVPTRTPTFLTRAMIDADDAVKGLTGLIALGNAWQSVDVFLALTLKLHRDGHAHLGELAKSRLKELLNGGARSLHPAMPTDPVEMKMIVEQRVVRGMVEDSALEAITAYFTPARAAADRWHEERTRFMLAKMNAGEHPDTHADFWTGYVEVPAEPVPGAELVKSTVAKVTGSDIGVYLMMAFAVAIPLGIVICGWVLIKSMRKQGRSGRLAPPAVRSTGVTDDVAG